MDRQAMPEFSDLTDIAVLAELGTRLARVRLDRDLTQAELAREAGVSKRTLVRLEGGESVQFTNFVRVLRALGQLYRLDALIPPPSPSPLQQLRDQGKRRRRASSPSAKSEPDGDWAWGDDLRDQSGMDKS